MAAQNDALAKIVAGGPDQSSAESKRLFEQNKTLSVAKGDQYAKDTLAALEAMYGKDSTAARQFVATLTGSTASTLDFVGGTLSGLGVTGPTNALTNAAKVLDQAAYSLNAEGVNQAAQNVVTDVTNAKGFVNKSKALIDSVIANPKSLNVVAVEVVQEGCL